MGKRIFMFPGQGSQYIGMGKSFYDAYPIARETYEMASEAAGLDVEKLCFEENDLINRTEYTQIAMVATEAAILRVLQEQGFCADAAAGLSLGEYTALLAAGVMQDEDVFSLIRKRGIYMQEAYPEGGKMVAVLGLDAETVGRVCAEAEGVVSVANYNCPGQTVISGEADAVGRASIGCKDAGAKRVLPLNVSGPFHSPLLQSAADRLAVDLSQIEISMPNIGYLSNVTADYVTDPDEIRSLLAMQMSHSVCWQQIIERLIADDADEFIEIGPGKSLSGFVRKINKDVRCINVDRMEDMEKLM